jgi:hypothetical protein
MVQLTEAISSLISKEEIASPAAAGKYAAAASSQCQSNTIPYSR